MLRSPSLHLSWCLLLAGCGGPQPVPTTGANPFGHSTAGATTHAVPAVATPAAAVPATVPAAESMVATTPPPAATAGQPAVPVVPQVAAADPVISPSLQPSPFRPGLAHASPASGASGGTKPLSVAPTAVSTAEVSAASDNLTTPSTWNSEQDWPRFRGPAGDGRAPADANPPVTWSLQENLLFTMPLSEAGSSSPIIAGQNLYLTGYVAEGVDPKRQNRPSTLHRFILCLDAETGTEHWKTEIGTDSKSPAMNGFISRHGYTSSTPTTDGERIYAYFGHVGLCAVEADGREIGVRAIGSKLTQQGSWASPIHYGSNVIVNASLEGGGLLAVDADGNELWTRGDFKNSTATPLLVTTPDGSEELVVCAEDQILGLSPETGEELWKSIGIDEPVLSSPVAHDGIVYVSGGKSATTYAIRTGGRGDISYTHRVWKVKEGADASTPVWHNDRLFLVSQTGLVVVLDTKTGKRLGSRQLEGATVFAAPLIAGDRLYVVTRESGVFVLSPDDNLEVLAVNRIAGDATPFNATPVVVGTRLYLRSQQALYCVEQPL